MPRGDRTGPAGAGPRTGRSLGYCSGYDTPGFMKGPGMGAGRGWGGGFGYGGGLGWRRGRCGGRGPWGLNYMPFLPTTPVYNPFIPNIAPSITPENQIAMLKQEKEYLESEIDNMKTMLENINKKMTEFEKSE